MKTMQPRKHRMSCRSLGVTVLLAFTSCATATASELADLFETVDSAVVVLYTTETVAAPGTNEGAVSSNGLGSGFVIDKDGHVMTAAHVVQTADFIRAEFVDGTQVAAKVISSNPIKDVALLQLETLPPNIRPLTLADSDKVRVGEEVFVIGAPYGLSHTLSVGHVSARHASADGGGIMGEVQAETFQTDASINQGNSGGPVFNRRGEVIGIVSYIRSRSGGSEGLGFAVTTNDAKFALFEQRTPWSGMSGVLLTGRLSSALNVPQAAGFLVQQVARNSPAEALGLRPSRIQARIGDQDILIGGDIILSIAGVTIGPKRMAELANVRERARKGTVELRILRSGEIMTLDAPMAPR